MIDYEIVWARTLEILPEEKRAQVEGWSELDQISVITEARGRAMYRDPASNGDPSPEAVRQVLMERLG